MEEIFNDKIRIIKEIFNSLIKKKETFDKEIIIYLDGTHIDKYLSKVENNPEGEIEKYLAEDLKTYKIHYEESIKFFKGYIENLYKDEILLESYTPYETAKFKVSNIKHPYKNKDLIKDKNLIKDEYFNFDDIYDTSKIEIYLEYEDRNKVITDMMYMNRLTNIRIYVDINRDAVILKNIFTILKKNLNEIKDYINMSNEKNIIFKYILMYRISNETLERISNISNFNFISMITDYKNEFILKYRGKREISINEFINYILKI
jgi:hypothetical protein